MSVGENARVGCHEEPVRPENSYYLKWYALER
jgi:hypothetical protein